METEIRDVKTSELRDGRVIACYNARHEKGHQGLPFPCGCRKVGPGVLQVLVRAGTVRHSANANRQKSESRPG